MLNELAQLIKENSGTAYLVGGAVRDEFLGFENKDLDVECFGINEDKLHSILEAFVWDANAHHTKKMLSLSTVGKSFKVFKLRDSEGNEIDVSLPRQDIKTGIGHRGFDVVANPFMNPMEAASRRDFTINAIYKDILTGEIFDPFNGREDLEYKQIRMVNENAFTEDPLRVLRAVQFAARFKFYIDLETWAKMKEVNLSELPAERIFTEMEKLLLKSDKPSRGLELFGHNPATKAYNEFWNKQTNNDYLILFPELDALKGVEQDKFWHPEGDVFVHTMLAIDEMAQIVKEKNSLTKAEKLTLMLAILCHDFGKSTTTEFVDGRWRAHGHSEAGLAPTTEFLDKLNIHSVDGFPVRQTVLSLVEHHLFPAQLSSNHEGVNVPRALRRMAQKVRLDLLAMVSLADLLGRGTDETTKKNNFVQIEWFLEEAKKSQVSNKPTERILSGKHLIELGMKPGKGMGEILRRVFEMQLDGQITNLNQALNTAKSMWAFGVSTLYV